nr:MAG TPA: hypothetical protein [Caudoviricetes sp.]
MGSWSCFSYKWNYKLFCRICGKQRLKLYECRNRYSFCQLVKNYKLTLIKNNDTKHINLF